TLGGETGGGGDHTTGVQHDVGGVGVLRHSLPDVGDGVVTLDRLLGTGDLFSKALRLVQEGILVVGVQLDGTCDVTDLGHESAPSVQAPAGRTSSTLSTSIS